MVGTPQPPLRYRRKVSSDFRVHSQDLDIPFHSSAPSLNSYRFTSECSMPHSPSFYSSSSIAPSSPVRSLYTPEPSSSPVAEPCIASSPKSPTFSGRKGFWEVAFNYGPDFPYKARPSVQTSNFSREQFITRRRSSSASAPPLVSDADPSDYSEDIDPFHMDDDITDGENVPGDITIASPTDEMVLNGRRDSHLPHDDIVDTRNNGKLLPGEIDVATVLLDLSRPVRFAPIGSKAEGVAIKPKLPLPLPLDSPRPPSIVPEDESALTDNEACAFTGDSQKGGTRASPCDVISANGIEVFTDADGMLGQNTHSEITEVYPKPAESTADVSANDAQEQTGSTEEDLYSSGLECIQTNVDMSSEIIVEETIVTSQLTNRSELSANGETSMIVDERLDPIVESIFSGVLTPISSPSLVGSELSELTELLSEPPSPRNNSVHEFTEAGNDTRHLWESSCVDVITRSSSPDPGPSKPRCGTDDQHDVPTERNSGQFEKGTSNGKPTGVHGEDSAEIEQKELDLKSKKKRPRSVSSTASRASSPRPSASCPVIPKPRKKRTKRALDDSVSTRREDKDQSANPPSLPRTSISSPRFSSSAPSNSHGKIQLPAALENDDADAKAEMCGCLVQAMALSRASSMPASSLVREVLRENPHLANQRSKSDWVGIISVVLKSNDVFGRIDRKGFDADDKPLEAQWFYVPENDPDQDRASLLREMMPKKRNETKKHKQYFFKPLGKISRWDPEDAL